MTAKFRQGDEVVIARTCGKEHGRYYYGGTPDDVSLKSKGKIKLEGGIRILLRLENGAEWNVHPDEIDFLDKSRLAELKGLVPGIQDLPRHPVFEIAEQTPVFLVDGKAYSLGTAKDGGCFYELRGKRTSLVEIGDFDSLEALMLDRAQPCIERIKESYAKEAQRELNSLRNLDGDLDIPQLIFKQVFPYLQDGHYKDKVSELLGVEGKSMPVDSKPKAKITLRLEQIADEIGAEVKDLIREIEQEGQEQAERTKKQSKLDALFGYEEPKPQKGASLLGKALDGRNAAIVEGAVYDLIAGSDGYFSLVKREEEKRKPKADFEIGDKIRMNAKAGEIYGNSKEGSEGIIKKIRDDREFEVEFSKLTGEAREVPVTYNIDRNYMENLSEAVNMNNATAIGLENKFLIELGKKVKVNALREHLSRDKIIDLLRAQDAELLAMAGRREYKGDGFGFVQNGERHYAYIEVPSFAIKSHYDGNYYLFDKSRVGVKVWKNGDDLRYMDADGEIRLVMIDNIQHPLTKHNVSYERMCLGDNYLPTNGKDAGEVIARILKKGREIAIYAYTKGGSWHPHRHLGICHDCRENHYKKNIISEKEARSLGVPIADGRRREWQ